jgi:hypothetical protein
VGSGFVLWGVVVVLGEYVAVAGCLPVTDEMV